MIKETIVIAGGTAEEISLTSINPEMSDRFIEIVQYRQRLALDRELAFKVGYALLALASTLEDR